MNLKNRQTVLALVAVAVVALFILDQIVISPMIAGWKKRAESIAELRKSLEKGRAMIERESITRRVWNDMRKNALPTGASNAEKTVLEAFDRWSRESGIAVNSIKPQWKRGADETHSLLECRVDAAGDIGKLTKFLYEVEHSEMALRIESVELTSRDPDGRQLSLGLSVSGLRLAPLGEN